VRAIKQAQSLGFTLREIRELIAVAESGGSAQQAARLAEGKIEEIDAKIQALRRMRRGLVRTLETCRCGGDVSRCDVLEGLGEPGLASTRPSRRTAARRRTP
jgi:DNA-binding transcriptional MerR regulator